MAKGTGGPIKVVQYVNQFFAGIGGEDSADIGPGVKEGAAGPALGLQQAMGNGGEVVATVYCGDNYVATNELAAAREVAAIVARYEPDVFVAGPSFGSGRYGMACGLISSYVIEELDIPAVSAMFPDAPGAEAFRAKVPIVPTAETAAGMAAALKSLARLALKLGTGEELGSPEEDGFLSRGIRHNIFSSHSGAERAVDMLVKKVAGAGYTTEWPLPQYDKVTPPDPISATEPILVGLVSEAGVVPKGNPDRMPSGWATKWEKYDLTGLNELSPERFETIHGGFDTSKANEVPDRLVALDAIRLLESEGKLRLHPYLYSTTGNMGSIKTMSQMGAEIAADLISSGVHAVIVGAT